LTEIFVRTNGNELFDPRGHYRHFFVVATSAFAVGLTDADHAYLVTQNVERSSPVVNGLSPKEQARLHGLINDSRTESDPTARAKIVHEALVEFESHQHWEAMNPGPTLGFTEAQHPTVRCGRLVRIGRTSSKGIRRGRRRQLVVPAYLGNWRNGLSTALGNSRRSRLARFSPGDKTTYSQ
jgi:hypothetical protein